MTIGERIRELRLSKGYTQKQLGEKCNMADSAIRRYELGKGNPTEKTLIRIASALEVEVFELIPGTYSESLACGNEEEYWAQVRERLRTGTSTSEFEERKIRYDLINRILKGSQNEIEEFLKTETGILIVACCIMMNKEGQTEALRLLEEMLDNPQYSIETELEEVNRYVSTLLTEYEYTDAAQNNHSTLSSPNNKKPSEGQETPSDGNK